MKKKLTMSAAVAALMGISGIALADTGNQFTPVENLIPDQRQAVFESLSQMTNGAELDWDRIAVGVDENGQIVILQKAEVAGGGSTGSPSSFGRAASAGSPSSFGMAVSTGSPSSFGMAAKGDSAE
jgi:hypothetical protein